MNGTGPDVGQVMAGHPRRRYGQRHRLDSCGRHRRPQGRRDGQARGAGTGREPANIILPDADLAAAVTEGAFAVMNNTG